MNGIQIGVKDWNDKKWDVDLPYNKQTDVSVFKVVAYCQQPT